LKKLLSVSFIVFFISSKAFCQKHTLFVSAGPVIGVPVSNSNFRYYFKNALGGTAQLNYGVTQLGSITTSVSYFHIGAKNQPVTKTSLTMIKAGYRTNFLKSGFFASADAGLAGYGSDISNFVIGAAAGYSFKVSKTSYIDLFPAYNLIVGTGSNNMWLTANVLYRFNLKKTKK